MERSSSSYGRYRESNSSSSSLLNMSGFSWPPRSYTCTFCRREFRSAQALGGHMNVHRRDRARLRHSPPPPPPPLSNPNPNPNPSSAAAASDNPPLPNLNFAPPLPPLLPPRYTGSGGEASPLAYTIPSFISPLNATALSSRRCDDDGRMKRARAVKALFGVGGLRDFMGEEDQEQGHGKEIVKLDMEFQVREDLDLELRLGYRN